jgi:hypothetical protein
VNDIKTRTAKAFEIASDVSKQLIALSTATIVFTATFPKEVCNEPVCQLTPCVKTVLLAAWGIHLVSIVLGIFFLMKLASLLDGEKYPSIKGNVAAELVRWQAILFSIGTILIIAYAISALFLI